MLYWPSVRLGPVVQSIVSLKKSLVEDLSSLTIFKINYGNIFGVELRETFALRPLEWYASALSTTLSRLPES